MRRYSGRRLIALLRPAAMKSVEPSCKEPACMTGRHTYDNACIRCSIISAHLYIVNWKYQGPGRTGSPGSRCFKKIARRPLSRSFVDLVHKLIRGQVVCECLPDVSVGNLDQFDSPECMYCSPLSQAQKCFAVFRS